jgi:hypothetical protein
MNFCMALVELSLLFTGRSHIVSDNKHAFYYPAILHREAIILEHEEKVNKYQAVLAAYLKDKYSIKASDKGIGVGIALVL